MTPKESAVVLKNTTNSSSNSKIVSWKMLMLTVSVNTPEMLLDGIVTVNDAPSKSTSGVAVRKLSLD